MASGTISFVTGGYEAIVQTGKGLYDLGKNLVQGNVDALPSLITHDPEKEKQEAQALIDEFNTQVVNGDSDSIMKYTGGM